MPKLITLFTDALCGTFLPALLFLCGTVFLFRLCRYIFSPKILRKMQKGSSLSSLWLALGGTLGVGNICGVVSALYIGGAGCVFWIWVCAVLSAFTKYAETVLAVKYRSVLPSGETVGGAPYYIKNALGMKKTASVFAFFCILTAFTVGLAAQVRSSSDIAELSLGLPREFTALAFFAALLALTLGKARAVSAFTSKAVPLLCLGYGGLCIASIAVFRENIPSLTRQIFTDAFTPNAGKGGFLAFLTCPALRLGITRGVMSSEAGCGTAPYAYAHDKNADAVGSGLLGIVEVLTDSLILCTLTAYAVLLPKTPLTESSAESVLSSFSAVTGAFSSYFIGISVFLFALAAAASWSFYASESARFLGLKHFNRPFALLYSVSAFAFCFVPEKAVWLISDLTVTVMALINIFCILLLSGKVKEISASAIKSQ